MIEHEKVILFGVAGAGKTTKCLEYIRTFLKTITSWILLSPLTREQE